MRSRRREGGRESGGVQKGAVAKANNARAGGSRGGRGAPGGRRAAAPGDASVSEGVHGAARTASGGSGASMPRRHTTPAARRAAREASAAAAAAAAANGDSGWASALPEGVLLKVMEALAESEEGPAGVYHAGRVCRAWREFAREVMLWDTAASRPRRFAFAPPPEQVPKEASTLATQVAGVFEGPEDSEMTSGEFTSRELQFGRGRYGLPWLAGGAAPGPSGAAGPSAERRRMPATTTQQQQPQAAEALSGGGTGDLVSGGSEQRSEEAGGGTLSDGDAAPYESDADAAPSGAGAPAAAAQPAIVSGFAAAAAAFWNKMMRR